MDNLTDDTEDTTEEFESEGEFDSTHDLRTMIVNYVGNRLLAEREETDNEEVNITFDMVARTMFEEFPEFVGIIAETNYMRGYQQGLDDATLLKTETEATA